MGGHGWGEVSRADFVRAVNVALDHGVNFFDTADIYGLGEGERTLGEALGQRRGEAIVATKFGVRIEGGRTFYDNSPAWIRHALEQSLRRLGTDHVDLYQIHYRDGATPLDDVVDTLLTLQDRGLIHHLGLSNIDVSEASDLSRHRGDFVSFQNEFSLASRNHEAEVLTFREDFGLTALTWGSLGQGILTGKYDRTSAFGPDDRRSRSIYGNFHGDKLAHNLRIVDVMREIAADAGRSVPAVAIRWILDHLPGSVAIAGIKNVSQLESNLEALGWHLSADQLAALDAVSSSEVYAA